MLLVLLDISAAAGNSFSPYVQIFFRLRLNVFRLSADSCCETMDPKRVLWIGASPQLPAEGRNSPWKFVYWPPERAIDQLRHTHYDAVVLDFPYPGVASGRPV